MDQIILNELVAALKLALPILRDRWQEANALRDSKAGGEAMRAVEAALAKASS